MSTDRDVERIVRSWMDEGVTVLPDRVLDLVLDQIPATPQRRSWWPSRRFPVMTNAVRIAVAAVAAVAIAILGISLLPKSGVGGPSATATPLPAASSAPLAVGSFASHGGNIQLDATGDGSNVTGSMTYTDVGGADLGDFTVDLACTRTTDSGLILIGGPVTDSAPKDPTTTSDQYAAKGSNVAIVLQRGSPVKAVFWFEHPDPHEPSCPAFLDTILDFGASGGDSSGLEPIEGTIALRP
jgi:hypothetical protein